MATSGLPPLSAVQSTSFVSARMRATAAALGQAARRYAGQDTAAAAALGAVRPWGTH